MRRVLDGGEERLVRRGALCTDERGGAAIDYIEKTLARAAELFRAWETQLSGAQRQDAKRGGGGTSAPQEPRGRAPEAEENAEISRAAAEDGTAERLFEALRGDAFPAAADLPARRGLPGAEPGAGGRRAGGMSAGITGQVLVSGRTQDDAANTPTEWERAVREAQREESAQAFSDRLERDARRYDGGFDLY